MLIRNPMLRILALAALLFLAACAAPSFNGSVYGAPAPPPDFTLPSTLGSNFRLSEQRGRVTLLFFGYTHCPDVCPEALGVVRAALNRLTPEEREAVDLIFITVDPERDTLPVIADYIAHFDPAFIGLRPTEAELQQLAADYAMFAEKDHDHDHEDDGEYLVSHTSLVYVIDKSGDLRLGFFSGMSPADMASDLSLLARE